MNMVRSIMTRPRQSSPKARSGGARRNGRVPSALFRIRGGRILRCWRRTHDVADRSRPAVRSDWL